MSSFKSECVEISGDKVQGAVARRGTRQSASQQKIKTRKKDICGPCMIKVASCGTGSDGILCNYCEFWFHASCEGMTKEWYKALSFLVDNHGINYYCKFSHCEIVNKEINKILGSIILKNKENSDNIEMITKNIEAITKKIVDIQDLFPKSENYIEQKIA